MIIKYDAEIKTEAVIKNIDRLTNQIFKLLPCCEEGSDWQTPLQNIIIEIAGMSKLLPDHDNLFLLLCKLEALLDLDGEKDFLMFRKNIFESLNLLTSVKNCL